MAAWLSAWRTGFLNGSAVSYTWMRSCRTRGDCAQLAESIGNRHLRENSRNGFIIPVWVSDTAAIPRDVPQSLRTFTDTLHLTNPAARKLPATYILTFERGKEPDAFQRFADRAKSRGWPVVRMEADHVPDRSNPEALVGLLEQLH
jgi:hypothetical protein